MLLQVASSLAMSVTFFFTVLYSGSHKPGCLNDYMLQAGGVKAKAFCDSCKQPSGDWVSVIV